MPLVVATKHLLANGVHLVLAVVLADRRAVLKAAIPPRGRIP
jgi:hypothetical protein